MDAKLQNKWKDEIVDSILNAANPVKCVESILSRPDYRNIKIENLAENGYQRFHIVSVGKAAVTMAQGLVNLYPDQIVGGVIVHKSDYVFTPDKWHEPFVIQGSSHPVPDERSMQAAQIVIEYLDKLSEKDFVYFLISGGGSALITKPEESISLEDMMRMNQLLLECGANINEINCIRKHIDQVKGGKLIKHTMPAGFCTLILSDVLGDPVDVIASGPTVPDNSTYDDAITIVAKYQLREKMPETIYQFLENGKRGINSETIKKFDVPEAFRAPIIIGGNRNSLKAAKQCADSLGMHTVILSDHLVGEAKDAARWIFQEARMTIEHEGQNQKTWCFLCGGETTVTIQGKGLGGRNLELALAAIEYISLIDNAFFVTFATDGEDGPTDAAGAWVSSGTMKLAHAKGLSVELYLSNNDSYHFFEKIGQLVKTGSSGTNVNDICFLIIGD
jgi:glycerate 2-kinase